MAGAVCGDGWELLAQRRDSQETQCARTAVEKPIVAWVKVSSEFPGFCVTVLHIIQTLDVFIVEDLSRFEQKI